MQLVQPGIYRVYGLNYCLNVGMSFVSSSPLSAASLSLTMSIELRPSKNSQAPEVTNKDQGLNSKKHYNVI